MAQAYLTTYGQDYKWHNYSNPRRGIKAQEKVYEDAPEGDIWITPCGVDNFSNQSEEYLQKFVTNMYKKRYISEYKGAYCRQRKRPPSIYDNTDVEESELINYGRLLFAPKTQKIMQPLPSARKLFGYFPPLTMYGGLSEYQGEIGEVGFNILLKNHLRILGLNKK